LKTILLACPATRGILFDQPQVIASADLALASAELAQRCQIVAGNFFESVPENCDAYVMKVIIHDWDDCTSVDILRTCRRAMAPTARLVVIERVVGPPNEMPEAKFSDLNMMVQYGAMERTRQEFDDLLKIGGFKITEVVPTRSPLSIIVAQPM
jgi:O-methyltransferase